MKRLGFRTVRISSIKAGGDVAKLRKDPVTREIEATLPATGGQPAEPIVLDRAGNLVAGRKRLAACLNADVKTLDVVQLDGTTAELEMVTLIENVRRKHMSAEERGKDLARLLELERKAAEPFPDIEDGADEPPEKPQPTEKRKPGRPKKATTKTREELADKLGSTPEAIRSSIQRGKADKAPAEKQSGIDTLGLDVPIALIERTTTERAVLSQFHADLVALQNRITRTEKESDGRHYETLYLAVHEAAALAKRMVPACVCLWCKGHPKLQSTCIGCKGLGYLTNGGMEVVTDAALRKGGDQACVYVNSRLVNLKDV